MTYIQPIMILSHLDPFSYRMVEHWRYSSQVTFSSSIGLIIYMYFINLHYKHIVMTLKFIIFPWHTSTSLWKIKCTIFLSHDRRFINLSNYWVDNIHKSNGLSYQKIVFTFLRTIWRTHSVLPFIITTMIDYYNSVPPRPYSYH